MTAFKKVILVIIVLFVAVWASRQYKPDMTIVYPDDCSFIFDRNFSYAMQHEMKSFIDEAYKKNKKPSNLLPSIEDKFSSIRSIVIDMNNPEQLNFTIQAFQPIFLVNNSLVVCKQGQLFEKNIFANDVIAKLENINYEGSFQPKDIDRLMKFVASLSDPILKDFSIRWVGKHNVWLDQKQTSDSSLHDLSLLVGYTLPPTMQDVAECRNLRGQIVDKPCKDKRGKPCKNNTTWVCDVRFDQQIVLFSTNKGG